MLFARVLVVVVKRVCMHPMVSKKLVFIISGLNKIALIEDTCVCNFCEENTSLLIFIRLKE